MVMVGQELFELKPYELEDYTIEATYWDLDSLVTYVGEDSWEVSGGDVTLEVRFPEVVTAGGFVGPLVAGAGETHVIVGWIGENDSIYQDFYDGPGSLQIAPQPVGVDRVEWDVFDATGARTLAVTAGNGPNDIPEPGAWILVGAIAVTWLVMASARWCRQFLDYREWNNE